MSPALLTLVIKQRHDELRWWARCCVQPQEPAAARRWVAQVVRGRLARLRPGTRAPCVLCLIPN